jgi:hypothetical protein
MTDDKDFDDMMDEEDNPYDNPDDTFYYEEKAYKAGYQLGYEDTENNNTTDLDDIDYSSFADEEIIEEFKRGVKEGSLDAIEKMYGDDDDGC